MRRKFLPVLLICAFFTACFFPRSLAESEEFPPDTAAENALVDQDSEEKIPVSLDIVLSEGKKDHAWRLTDGNANSWIQFDPDDELSVKPEKGAAALLIEWYDIPSGVTVTACGESGETVEETVCRDLYEDLVPIPEGCLSMNFSSEIGFGISEITLLDAAEAEDYLPLEIPEKVDLMLVAAHHADETAWMTGVIPYYAGVRGLKTLSVYLSYGNRQAIRQTLEVQRMYGETSQPVFFSWNKYYFMYEKYAAFRRRIWDHMTNASALTALVRQYHPEVIVSMSEIGEHNDAMHRLAGEFAIEAAEWATLDNRDRSSFRKLGLWEVPKVYLHVDGDTFEGNAVSVDLDAALPSGISIRETAAEALGKYRSLGIYRLSVPEKSEFSLVRTSVGDDTSRNDLFENIPLENLSNKGEYPPVPVLKEPKPEETAAEPETVSELVTENTEAETAPVNGPADSSELPPAPQQETETAEDKSFRGFLRSGDIRLFLAVAACAVLTIVLLILLNRKGFSWIGTLLSVIPLALAFAFCAYMYHGYRTNAPAVAADAAPIQAPEPVPASEGPDLPDVPAPEEEKEPKEAEPVEEDPDAEYFRRKGEEEEVIVQDDESGRWEYRSDYLSILIDRVNTTGEKGKPLVYYVAHIRMREFNSYRSGLGYFNEAGSGKEKPYILARRDRAVLAITGDNLVNAGTRNKGVLIRKGRLYFNGTKNQATMALTDDMAIRIYPKGTRAEIVVQDGIQDSYGFGPILVENSQIHPDTRTNHLKKLNPRCGIGMVEPGHLVAIVVDGRQAGYSIGVSLEDYAKLFLEEGCTVAFNMDGGVSAGMVFMGEHINRHANATGKRSSQRPWPDALLFGYSDLVPHVDDPIINTGNGVEADRNRRKAEEKEREKQKQEESEPPDTDE